MAMTEAEMKVYLKGIKSKIRVTKVIATRSVKGKGDTFAGFSAAWDSVQPDAAGQGKDLLEVVPDSDVADQGMTLKEARIAHYILQRQADIAAYEGASASGGISWKAAQAAIKATRNNYDALIAKALKVKVTPSADVAEVPSEEVAAK